MKLQLDKDPEVYLSGSNEKWTIIYQGSPLCDYKKTAHEALAVAKEFKLQPHTFYWDSTELAFLARSDVDHFQADEAQAFTLTHSPSPTPKDTTRPLF
jgi:hypothetical protein